MQVANRLASGNFGGAYGQTSFEIDDNGTITSFELADALPTTALAGGALAAAALSILNRTRNPAA